MNGLITALFFLLFLNCSPKRDEVELSFIAKNQIVEKANTRLDRTKKHVQELEKMNEFLNKYQVYNKEVAFLLDFKTPSNRFRFYVVNPTTGAFLDSGLVAHGSGSQFSSDSLDFSNVPESYKSSLGMYKVGAKYKGNFGWSYKLHGLDDSNSNAYKRLIVLHPYGCVPDDEQVDPICFSLGCPMVSYRFMDRLYGYIDGTKKPILLNAYY